LKSNGDAIRRRPRSGSHRSHNHRAQVVVHFRRRDDQAGLGLADLAAGQTSLSSPASANLRLASAQPWRGLRLGLRRTMAPRSSAISAYPASFSIGLGIMIPREFPKRRIVVIMVASLSITKL
jgi:hypothetical protein